MRGVEIVWHAATLHMPNAATHRRRDFIDTNITGTLNLLEEAAAENLCALFQRNQNARQGFGSRRQVKPEYIVTI
jgi:nucleoside-diphosphate-sugar epimerase